MDNNSPKITLTNVPAQIYACVHPFIVVTTGFSVASCWKRGDVCVFLSEVNRKRRLVQLMGLRCSSIDWGQDFSFHRLCKPPKRQTHAQVLHFAYISFQLSCLHLPLLFSIISPPSPASILLPRESSSVHPIHTAYRSVIFSSSSSFSSKPILDWKERVCRAPPPQKKKNRQQCRVKYGRDCPVKVWTIWAPTPDVVWWRVGREGRREGGREGERGRQSK